MLRRTTLAVLAATTLTFAAHADDPPEPVGRIDIDSTQLAFIFSGSFGGGKLWYGGKVYEFEVGGLGVGGIGTSSIDAEGRSMK